MALRACGAVRAGRPRSQYDVAAKIKLHYYRIQAAHYQFPHFGVKIPNPIFRVKDARTSQCAS